MKFIVFLYIFATLSNIANAQNQVNKPNGIVPKIEGFGPWHQTPVISYEDFLAILLKKPYPLDNLPIIPVNTLVFQMANLQQNVIRRSIDILKERSMVTLTPKPKPIHPMGTPVVGSITLYPNSSPYSGLFKGGTFKVLSRWSLSQGNPFKHKIKMKKKYNRHSRPRVVRYWERTQKPQERSLTMSHAIFAPNDTVTIIALQNDLNGRLNSRGVSPNFLGNSLSNHPDFDPLLLLPKGQNFRRDNWATLIGVLVGAKLNPLEKAPHHEASLLGVTPLLRPPHGMANLMENDPDNVLSPVWINFVPRDNNPEIIAMDDFRLEIYNSINQNGAFIYDVMAAHESYLDDHGSIQRKWIHVGEYTAEKALPPSLGADQISRFPHGDNTAINYFTGKVFYEQDFPTSDSQD